MRRKIGKTWSCSADCPDFRAGKLCKHLEKLLPSIEGPGSKKLVFDEYIERREETSTPLDEYLLQEAATLTQVDEPHDRLVDEKTELRLLLMQHSLPEKKISVVVDRIIHGLTFREIALDRGFNSATAAYVAYTDAITVLSTRIPPPKPRGKK